ncbi:ATP-binding protein [Agromyces sp. H66]|uniref:ATP-binding protein n=1 Tax=Agromyces sp. H66 TaxID=2529859 RepID=UPI0010A9B566|nr:ATP-binding protein [Agromyces sp. H66]
MLRRWGWFAALAPLGTASLVYAVIARGFIAGDAGHGLAWPLLGILPLFTFGMWLLTASTSRSALYIAWASTAMAVGSAVDTFVRLNVDVVREPWFPAFSLIGLIADAVTAAGFISMFATFPTGIPERRWQRIMVALFWLPVVVAPLSLLTTPHAVTPLFLGVDGEGVPNPFAVPWLEWADPIVEWIVYLWPSAIAGIAVLIARAFFGDPEVRKRMRVMTVAVLATVVSWSLWTLLTPNWLADLAVYVSLAAVPLAAIHGILRYGAFDISPGDRSRFVARSSDLLITLLYGVGTAAPGVLLADVLSPVGAVLLTTVAALLLLPVRSLLQRWIHWVVFADLDRQLAILGDLGAQLERAGEPLDLLTRLAEAVHDGLHSSWVRIRIATIATEDHDLVTPVAIAGDEEAAARDEPVLSSDLVRGDETLGRIEVGPRRRGEYSDAERALLRTVAGQAAASVANVRLTARLAEQLDELTASRERLVAAQDDERRRLERDLHDGIQQDVVAQIAGLRLARNRLERGQLTPEELAELQDQARATLNDLRELARGIHPPVLSDNGLVAAVESGVARFPIPLAVEAEESVRGERFPEEVETTAYYVVREALANAAKHANATHASVAMARSNGRLRISISDDGRGIGPIVPASVSRGGLANIRDRVAALRGTMRVTSDGPSGTGTTVLVELPVGGVAPAAGAPREGAPVG